MFSVEPMNTVKGLGRVCFNCRLLINNLDEDSPYACPRCTAIDFVDICSLGLKRIIPKPITNKVHQFNAYVEKQYS